jgi:SAM-dependent methyltransferase
MGVCMDDKASRGDSRELDKPSAARMYDYYLGGAHNFTVDREAAAKVLEIYPKAPLVAQANRAFLRRATRYLLDQGVRQFLDLGSGIPTVGNVHEVVEASAPGARVVYVDIDPIAVVHSESILASRADVGVVRADIRRPADVLDSPVTRALLDFTQPIGLLSVAVLHFVGRDGDPEGLLARFRDALAPGSYLVLSHGTPEEQPEAAARSEEIYGKTRDPLTLRTRNQISALFAGWQLVEPGLVWLPEWHPDWPEEVGKDPSWTEILCGVGRKP